MAKEQAKLLKNKERSINTTSDTPTEYNSPLPSEEKSINSTLKKTKQQIDKEYYEKNKERKRQQRRERYQQQKIQSPKKNETAKSDYYGAEAIKVLMSLKEYTELNKTKHQIWYDFVWTLKDLTDNGAAMNIHDIINVMTIREKSDKLINDYWTTAKSEGKKWGQNWKWLDQDKRDRLIKYWGQKKWQEEKQKTQGLENQQEGGSMWEKEIAQMVDAKVWHEERGKKGCNCYYCKETKKRIVEDEKELKELMKKQDKVLGKEKAAEYYKGECSECYEEKRVSVESGLCRKCEREANKGDDGDDYDI